MQNVYTTKDLCDYLQICQSTAYSLMKRKDFPSFRVPYGKGRGSWRVQKDALDQWIDTQKINIT